MIELRRAEAVDVDVRKFLADVREEIQVKVDAELRVMPALQEDLHAADGRQFVEFPVELINVVRCG